MTAERPFHDALGRLARVPSATGVQLVRLLQLDRANRYTARPIEFDSQGDTVSAGEEALGVTNLAEPADSAGQIPEDIDAVALDVEGRWVVFVRPPGSRTFPARVVASRGGSAYVVREQIAARDGTFQDRTGASNLTAHNLAELSLGIGAAVDPDAIVPVSVLLDRGDPPATRYVFDHPAYARYLD